MGFDRRGQFAEDDRLLLARPDTTSAYCFKRSTNLFQIQFPLFFSILADATEYMLHRSAKSESGRCHYCLAECALVSVNPRRFRRQNLLPSNNSQSSQILTFCAIGTLIESDLPYSRRLQISTYVSIEEPSTCAVRRRPSMHSIRGQASSFRERFDLF